ncbi:hypothetical protein ACFFF7_02740 [Novosphingobium aquiterrae]|uniref:Uncharacterized protein n=1 Tax=Novosphingobium aquiterrae TaxID=624388 RepID=A0ABV6PER3_9SPHN
MIDLIFAAARRAVPVARDHTRYISPPVLRHPGVLTREELRRAVAEVIG